LTLGVGIAREIGFEGGRFAALRYPNYRLLWIGTLISNTGDWIDQIALNWLIITTTHSAAWLGIANLCRGLPIMVFTLIGGVTADRVNRRLLMMTTQSAAMIVAVILAVLVVMDAAPIWAILVLAICRGIIISFNLPARHTLISELVPRGVLPNAVALNSVTINLCKVMGPLIAGIVLATLGTAACFMLNALSFTAVLATLFCMDIPAKPATGRVRESLARSLGAGLSYVRHDRKVLLLVLVALVPTFFGQPYLQLLAIFAHDVFQAGPTGLGLMTASAATGSVCGGLIVAGLPNTARRGTIMIAFMASFGAALVLFALSPSFYVALAMLFCTGAMQVSYNTSNNAILQLSVSDEYRGRVLSTLFLNRGLVSSGVAITAGLSVLIGARLAMAGMAAVIVVFAIWLACTPNELRKLKV
jgi:MFS family permease